MSSRLSDKNSGLSYIATLDGGLFRTELKKYFYIHYDTKISVFVAKRNAKNKFRIKFENSFVANIYDLFDEQYPATKLTINTNYIFGEKDSIIDFVEFLNHEGFDKVIEIEENPIKNLMKLNKRL